MQNHTKVYMRHFNFGIDDFIPCEICSSRAVDIHHIVPRSKITEGRDDITNLMALCRLCHTVYGQNKLFNEWLSARHRTYIIQRQSLN